MDSVSQFVLGAACGVAVMGRRTAVWKAALWGGIAGTLPDLDVLIDHGDPIADMTLHRAESHAVFLLALASLPLGALVAWLLGERAQWPRWVLATAAALITHPLLDAMTVYGTQLLRPFSSHPYGVGSIFIIDPLYTLPLIAGVVGALLAKAPRDLRWNAAGLLLSTAYLAWSVAAQSHVSELAQRSLERGPGSAPVPLLVTPTPFNTVLWRVVAMRDDGYDEGFVSLLDRPAAGQPPMRFVRHATDTARLAPAVQENTGHRRMAAFTHGFYALHERPAGAPSASIVLEDLRMGQTPNFTFSFAIADRGDGAAWQAVTPRMVGRYADPAVALPWLWRRLRGEELPPPG
jgi:inner membrane protein